MVSGYFMMMALIQFLRGWGPIDPPYHVNTPRWRKWANVIVSDWACGGYVVLLLLPSVAWWQALLSGLLYVQAEYWIIKRVLFGCWNGDVSAYTDSCWYKQPMRWLARPFMWLPSKAFAAAYGAVCGLAWASVLLPLGFHLSALCCLFLGPIYALMHLIPDHWDREAVARTIFGGMLGIAMTGAIS